MILYEVLFQPFMDYGFMRRALVACFALALGCGPVGVFLTLRRMSLMGDAMSHAILPGAAIAFMLYGLSLWPMTIGGFVAALVIAVIAGVISRTTKLREDSSFAGLYLISLAAGVLLISLRGSTVDLMHVLFGNILSVDEDSLLLVASIASITLLVLALMFRALIIECVDSGFLQGVGARGAWWHLLFVALVVINLVAGFQALGTLMALGLMILPAICTRFWTRHIDTALLLSVLVAAFSGWVGLLLSYHADVPSGPAIVLVAGVAYIASMLFGNYHSLRAYTARHHHYEE
jgi:zinc/manganese transport system permease protein